MARSLKRLARTLPSVTRRRFLGWLSALALFPASRSGAFPSGAPAGPLVLRRRRPSLTHTFAPFPVFSDAKTHGAGTYQAGDPSLLTEALERGVRLVDTSPDYRRGQTETVVGHALETADVPVFVMTQIPQAAWDYENREAAFHRALRQSLGRLRRHHVEALLVRNAEPDQLDDPGFRAFARKAKDRGLVGTIGASGHGLDLEKILERSLEDDLIEIVLFAAHLAGFRTIPDLLPRVRERGVRLVAMKTREAAFYNRAPGWEAEAERRRHRPWDGKWDPGFTRRALSRAVTDLPADNAVLSLRDHSDLAVLKGMG